MAIVKRITVNQTAHKIEGVSNVENYPNRFIFFLFLLFVINTVIPVFDIPFLGLSISAVFFALVALEVSLKLKFLGFRLQARWILLAYAFWSGISVSIFANGIFGTLSVELSSIVRLIQLAYWLGVFLIMIALFSHLKVSHIHQLIWILGTAALALGAMRLYEAIVFNRTSPGTAEIFTQNAYGILFSTFTPFALILPFITHRARLRVTLVLAVLALLLAIGLNGSRSSWVATSFGIIIMGILLGIARRRSAFGLVALLGVVIMFGTLFISALPSEIVGSMSSRFLTLERYEEDKSYATRTLMQQKSILLFESSALYGVGRGEFRNTRVTFDYSDTPYSANPTTDFNRIASHNSYAQLLGETGLAGTVPLIILLFMLITLGSRAAMRLCKTGNIWAAATFTSFVAMSIHMWFIDNLNTTGPWLIYGLVAGMVEYHRRNYASRHQ